MFPRRLAIRETFQRVGFMQMIVGFGLVVFDDTFGWLGSLVIFVMWLVGQFSVVVMVSIFLC